MDHLESYTEAVVARTGAAMRSATWRGNPADVASRMIISKRAGGGHGDTGEDDGSSLGKEGPVMAGVTPDGLPEGSVGLGTTAGLASTER